MTASRVRLAVQLAGVATSEGLIGPAVAGPGWALPAKVQADADRVTALGIRKTTPLTVETGQAQRAFDDSERGLGVARADAGLLGEFVNLANSPTPRRVAAFVRRFGFLALHTSTEKRPVLHPSEQVDAVDRNGVLEFPDGRRGEPVAHFIGLADLVGDVLLAAADSKNGRPDSAWEHLSASQSVRVLEKTSDFELRFMVGSLQPSSWQFPSGATIQCNDAASAINSCAAFVCDSLLAVGTVHTGVSLEGQLHLESGPACLMSAIAFQLAAVCSGAGEVVARCSGCNVMFKPNRVPRGSERSWCPQCRTNGASARAASADNRARNRAQAT